MLAGFPAMRFRLPGKGRIAVGCDADFALVDLKPRWVMEREMLLQRHPISPYVGRTLQGRVVKTILRGIEVTEGARGKLVKPAER